MEIDYSKPKEIEEKLARLPFKDSMYFYIQVLNYYAKTKSKQNFFMSHSFVKYIDENFGRFRLLIEKEETIKKQLQDLFKLNEDIDDDNLISVIIDDANNDRIIQYLNEQLNFKNYYLTDKIMSMICAADNCIYEGLDNKQKKYIYSALYNVYYSREEQIKIYKDNLQNYPKDFVKKLFSFSEIICENTPNEIERHKEINKKMFNFFGRVIEKREKLNNYLYNVTLIYKSKPSEKDLYNTFLISIKYPEIHEELLNSKINDNNLYEKLKLLSSLPSLKGIVCIDDLNRMSISELYNKEIDDSIKVEGEPDSADARNDYQCILFRSNRDVIKITDEETNLIQLTDDKNEYSHIYGLKKLYPEYQDKEVLGEIIISANTINHDIIITTEGDSINIWLPNIDNISISQIDRLKTKLDEIRDIRDVSITIATESNGTYLEIPFSTPDILIEYLKANKKVK